MYIKQNDDDMKRTGITAISSYIFNGEKNVRCNGFSVPENLLNDSQILLIYLCFIFLQSFRNGIEDKILKKPSYISINFFVNIMRTYFLVHLSR